MMKTALLLAQILLPSPDSPRVQAAFNQLTTDYATCHAYFDLLAKWYDISSPRLAVSALGGVANAGYEGTRMEKMANLPEGTFYKRRAAMMQDMQKSLDSSGFSVIYSAYDGFCEDLREDPGKAFLRRLPREHPPTPTRKPRPLKSSFTS